MCLYLLYFTCPDVLSNELAKGGEQMGKTHHSPAITNAAKLLAMKSTPKSKRSIAGKKLADHKAKYH